MSCGPRDRCYVSNAIRLLKLPGDAQDALLAGRLSAGHARAILAADDPAALAQAVLERGLSVREAEALAKGQKAARPKAQAPAEIRALERRLQDAVGADVRVNQAKGGKVTVRLVFGNSGQAETVLWKLMQRG